MTYTSHLREPDRFSPPTPCENGIRISSFWLGLPCLLYGLMSLSLRGLNEWPLLIAVACGASAVAGSAATLTSSGSWPIRWRYIAFFLFSSTIFMLSLAHVMPSSWTNFYDRGAAFRQWFYVPVLPILIAYFTLAIRHSYDFVQRKIVIILFFSIVMSRISQNLNGIFDLRQTYYFTR